MAAASVVLFHTEVTLALPKYWGRSIFHLFSPGYCGVEFFFVLSGFVILLAHRNDFGRTDKVVPFLVKRFRRIYPTLWATLAVMIPVTFLMFRSQFDLAGLPGALLILPSLKETWLAVEWTLRHEIIFYLLFALCLWKPKLGLPVLAVWAILSIGDVIFDYDNQWIAWFLARFHLLFAAGMVAGWLFINNKIALPRVQFILGVLLFSATWALNCTLNPWPQKFYEMLYGAGAFLMIVGIVRLEQLKSFRIPRPLIFLGDASYAIYLVNFPVISAAAKIGMAFRHLPGGDVMAWIFTVVLAVSVGCVFHLFVEKPLLRFFTRITERWASPSLAISASGEVV